MKPTPSAKAKPSTVTPPRLARPSIRPGAPGARSRSLHWLAWAAALVSVAVLVLWKWGPQTLAVPTLVQGADVGLAVFFALEFFTRTGWRRSRTAYLKWRWFDFVALLPVTVLGPFAIAPLIWFVFICRVIRLVDRTLGDGFVQRNVLLFLEAVEEEISDRVLEKMLVRWEGELKGSKFGTATAQALERNKEAVLRRVFDEQLQDGTIAKIAHFTGLQAALEKEERRLFDAVIEMVGSHEVDEAIRDVVASSLRRTREQLGARDWRRRLGATMLARREASPPFATSGVPSTGG